MAPHFSRYIKDNFKGDQIHTCLDMRIQTISEKLLGEYVKRAIAKGVTNGAVLVIDNRTASVVGYCGSADFNNKLYKGEVNGVIAIRSPGSTLKPALYAEAFDSGELTPKMTISDIPVDYSGYAPENFTLDFKGEVTIESALRLSLNIPAVKVLNKIGIDPFIRFLDKAGFRQIAKKRKGLGLSLILGGCGATLEQLTRLYSSFANNGIMYELNYMRSDRRKNGISLFSPGASYMISHILSSNERPDFPNYLLYSTRLPKIAWKTGTSFGKKDAWAIAFNPRFTIGVWIGNFDGKGAPQLSGAEMAVPLLFELFNAIDYSSDSERWFAKPPDVSSRTVCSETGLLPTEDCSKLEEDYYIFNVSHNRNCDLYREIIISSDRSVQYCLDCLPPQGNWTKVKYPIYEPELELWFTKTGRNIMRPPPHNPECRTRFSSEGPVIVSPSKSYEYIVERGSGQQIMLLAASTAEINKQYWYVNNKFLAESKPGNKLFFTPVPGDNVIICMDDKGRRSSITISVKFY
jgi:penicillin-binding protein 1C